MAFLIPLFDCRGKSICQYCWPILFHHFLGVLIFIAGILILLLCIWRFIIDGKGTLSPLDPTRRLVTTGLYRITRNPMYVGVILILLGEFVILSKDYSFVYVDYICCFPFFIIFWEEPRLWRDFGAAYEEYKAQTRRWI